jgi:NitT/TauT family transport system ATP-binding protein
MIHATSLTKTYGQKVVLKNLTFHIKPQEFVCILGPSGCGKSTLFRLLSKLDRKFEGDLKWHSDIKFSMVFQEPRLLPWFRVSENIRITDYVAGTKISENQVLEILNTIKLAGAAQLFPHQLSGGMKMRVALARALLSKPNTLFLDEPFSAVDENNRQILQELIRKIHIEENLTTLFITHSLSEALFLADRILMLNHLGQLVYDAAVDLPKLRDVTIRSSRQLSELLVQLQKPFQDLVQ